MSTAENTVKMELYAISFSEDKKKYYEVDPAFRVNQKIYNIRNNWSFGPETGERMTFVFSPYGTTIWSCCHWIFSYVSTLSSDTENMSTLVEN